MPYIYNSSASSGSAVSENLQPVPVPPVGRYIMPWGLDPAASTQTYIHGPHIPVPCVQYIPFRPASTITVDRASMFFADGNGCTDTWYYDLGLYTHNATTTYPSTQIAYLGTFAYVPGTTALGGQEITISQTLTGNTTYWLAIGIRNNVPFPSNDLMAGERTPFIFYQQGDFKMFRNRGNGGPDTSSGGMAWVERITTYSYPLPTNPSYSDVVASTPTFPRILLRRSA
jgi:hypothetical protein